MYIIMISSTMRSLNIDYHGLKHSGAVSYTKEYHQEFKKSVIIVKYLAL